MRTSTRVRLKCKGFHIEKPKINLKRQLYISYKNQYIKELDRKIQSGEIKRISHHYNNLTFFEWLLGY